MVIYPALLKLEDEDDYRAHYLTVLCRTPATTFDGITIRFRPQVFDHAFSQSLARTRTKDSFSFERAERMGWIRLALGDADAEVYYGWDRDDRLIDYAKRVVIVQDNYLIISRLHATKNGTVAGEFVTAYVGSASTLVKARDKPKWDGLR